MGHKISSLRLSILGMCSITSNSCTTHSINMPIVIFCNFNNQRLLIHDTSTTKHCTDVIFIYFKFFLFLYKKSFAYLIDQISDDIFILQLRQNLHRNIFQSIYSSSSSLYYFTYAREKRYIFAIKGKRMSQVVVVYFEALTSYKTPTRSREVEAQVFFYRFR